MFVDKGRGRWSKFVFSSIKPKSGLRYQRCRHKVLQILTLCKDCFIEKVTRHSSKTLFFKTKQFSMKLVFSSANNSSLIFDTTKVRKNIKDKMLKRFYVKSQRSVNLNTTSKGGWHTWNVLLKFIGNKNPHIYIRSDLYVN